MWHGVTSLGPSPLSGVTRLIEVRNRMGEVFAVHKKMVKLSPMPFLFNVTGSS
jgi:hypothetical protein